MIKNIFSRSESCSKLHWFFVVWSIIGLAYIVTDIKMTLEDKQTWTQQAYNEGIRAGVLDLVTQAMDLADQCEIVPLVMQEKQVNLMNVDCLNDDSAEIETSEVLPQE